MIARFDRRALVWGVAATLLVAAFLLALTVPGSAETTEPVIDTAAPVDSSQCAPCHLDLGDVTVPGLVFGHGNHLLVSCDGCHTRMPHRSGATERVPMDTCFACHGVQHGPQGELASSGCATCHTASFTLRPRNHVKDWAETPHAAYARDGGVNRCMMCHDAPEDCDACHAETVPELSAMPAEYHTLIEERPKGPSAKIYPEGPVTMSQCVSCHPDLDAITPGRLIFAHGTHVGRNYRCETCHATFAHSENGIARPDMRSCYRCHGVVHASQGEVATDDCLACHPAEFELMPADHTRKFILSAHKQPANDDPAYCAMCHQSSFCVGCHRGKKVSPNAPGRPIVPQDHLANTWLRTHGGFFLVGDGACGSCHDDASCKRCHKTVMPHPTGWIEDHSPEPGVTTADCQVCHVDRESCQLCHHKSVQRSTLVAENCVGCHEEMKKKPPTDIKNKGFAEHAVHFEVAKKKGSPYTCDDCHIGFGTSDNGAKHNGQTMLPDASHDVRLCYGCHGSVDYENKLIAPYPGASLCLRCHDDLGI